MFLTKIYRNISVAQVLRKTSYSAVTNAAKVPKESANDDANISKKPKNTLVAAAFESLKSDVPLPNSSIPKVRPSKDSAAIDERIINAKTVSGLLSTTDDGNVVNRKQALKIVSILAEWTSLNRIKLTDFENDARFIKLCRLLGRAVPKNNNGNGSSTQAKKVQGFRTDDLNTVLGIAGDDEAAKMIASISLPQMVKVMTVLAQKKRRSTPLLRSLAFNISSSSTQLDLKKCGDLLYAMASLNFLDSVLIAKICADIQVTLKTHTDKPAVVGSILTSLGLLKYRDLDVLESLVDWVLKNTEVCRPQDISSMFLTIATLNFKSSKMDQIRDKLSNVLSHADFPKPSDWLSHVWALTLLKIPQNEQIESVLKQDFIDTLSEGKSGLTPTMKMKLLNINAYAKLFISGYEGPTIDPESPIASVSISHSKFKLILVNGMLDALKNLLHSSAYVKSLEDTKMGFVIDAHCMLDAKTNPLPLDKNDPKAIRVAIMVIDFHDMCHGTHRSLSGITSLTFDLLENMGYKVLTVPFNEFNTSDKLLKRVQYLEAKLKSIVSTKN